jgi:hypothetical protein
VGSNFRSTGTSKLQRSKSVQYISFNNLLTNNKLPFAEQENKKRLNKFAWLAVFS